MQSNNLETFPNNGSGVSLLQLSLQKKKKKEKKKEKNRQTPSFLRKEKQVNPSMVPHTGLCLRAP